MNMRVARIGLLAVLPGLLLAAPPGAEVEPHLKKFLSVLTAVEEYNADPVPLEGAIYQGAIPSMLQRLDPHSAFFDPGQFEQLQQMEKSLQKGFGTVVSVLPGRVIILQVLPNTPAMKAGLSSGDAILAVNNIPLNRLDMEQIVQVLGQSRQAEARLIVQHPNKTELAELTLKPETMASPSVDRAYLLAGNVGYVRVTSFDNDTGRLTQESIEKLGGASLQGLVLDLRDNPGGVVDAALTMAGLFLQPEKLIVTVRGRSFQSADAKVAKDAKPYTFPVAVLVNGKSASASEIVAGALQDHDRAVIIGENTYGKGLVQSILPLSNKTAMALTTAFYYTPSGRSIQKPLKSGELRTESEKIGAGEARSDAGRVLRGGGGIEPDFRPVFEQPTRLRIVMEASGSFSSFAAEYCKTHKIEPGFVVTPELSDEFRVWLAERRIQPGASEWAKDREWTRDRLRQEILTVGIGVAAGDEVEVKRDPAVLLALTKLSEAR